MRICFLFAMPWQASKGLIMLALFGTTALGQAHSSPSDSRLDLTSVNSVSVNLVPISPRTVALSSTSATAASPVASGALPETPEHHKFWDKENRALFAAVAALSAADFVVTRRQSAKWRKRVEPGNPSVQRQHGRVSD